MWTVTTTLANDQESEEDIDKKISLTKDTTRCGLIYLHNIYTNRSKILSVHSELMNIICPMEWRFSSIRSHIRLSTIFCVRSLFSFRYGRCMRARCVHSQFVAHSFNNKFPLFSLRAKFSSKYSPSGFRGPEKISLFIS